MPRLGFNDVNGMVVPGGVLARFGKLTATGRLELELNGSMDIANTGSCVGSGCIFSGRRS